MCRKKLEKTTFKFLQKDGQIDETQVNWIWFENKNYKKDDERAEELTSLIDLKQNAVTCVTYDKLIFFKYFAGKKIDYLVETSISHLIILSLLYYYYN